MSVFDLPMTARPGKDAPVGQDELGRTVYRTVTGERYTMPERTEMPGPTMGQRFENLGGLASRAYENLSVQGAIDAAKGIGEGIVSGIVQGFTAPGRALSGEPVSLGDVLATAGMSQVGAAPLRAPAGALRSGAMGRPPVTFDDVARAMDEGAPAPSPSFTLYQGSPHNFAAERLVRYPDGRTEYIVGAPDVLPDVPAGAEVLQDFPLGRQRMDKIGTGEGAQAYGHGLYFAENEGVARGYRDALSGAGRIAGGNTAKDGSIASRLSNAFGSDGSTWRRGDRNIGDYAKRLAVGSEQGEDGETIYRFADGSTFLDFGDFWDVSDEAYSKGSVYEVNINADPEKFIDWDKPLNEQPQFVRDILGIGEETAGGKLARAYKNPLHGGDVARMDRADPAQVSAALREKGIPGIRFFDAGSRGANAGTRNFVIFDENLISIVRKYGIAGAAAMLGVSAVEVEQALADNLPPSQWDKLVNGSQ